MDVTLARKAMKNNVVNPFGGTEADDTDGEDVREQGIFCCNRVVKYHYILIMHLM